MLLLGSRGPRGGGEPSQKQVEVLLIMLRDTMALALAQLSIAE